MTRLGRVFLSLSLLWLAGIAAAQQLTLPKDSEEGFRKLIGMAQGGALGDDVINANVGIAAAGARLELVRAAGPPAVLWLSPKGSQQATSRYFDITPGEHAGAGDVARAGQALDACFLDDPFQFAGLEESLSSSPLPGWATAWAYGGWRGIVRLAERRMMRPASLEYTVGVIVVVWLGLLASLALLWGSAPPCDAAPAPRRHPGASRDPATASLPPPSEATGAAPP